MTLSNISPIGTDGIIAFIGGESRGDHVLCAIETRKAFPQILVSPQIFVIDAHGATHQFLNADHLSAPPDLRIHLTTRDSHVFLDVTPLWEKLINKATESLVVFTYVGAPFFHTKPLLSRRKKRSGPSILVSPLKDATWSPYTRFCIEFVLHYDIYVAGLDGFPNFYNPAMSVRFARDHGGSCLGPFRFDDLFKKNKPNYPDLLCSIKMFYLEIADHRASNYLAVPFGIYKIRPK